MGAICYQFATNFVNSGHGLAVGDRPKTNGCESGFESRRDVQIGDTAYSAKRHFTSVTKHADGTISRIESGGNLLDNKTYDCVTC
jgi:hypothetical protein